MQTSKNPIKSIHGRKCLTKCQPRGTNFVHPIVLSNKIDYLNDICAIYPISIKNKTGDIETKDNDECRLEDNYTNDLPNEIETLLLHFYFNSADFLGNIYDIYSFDDAIKWTMENSYLPKNTIKRVHNCAWKAFGSQGIHSASVFEYYYNLTKNKWIDSFIDLMGSDILIPSEMPDPRKYVIETILPFGTFVGVIKQFVNDNKGRWTEIKSYPTELKNYVYAYLNEKIKKNVTYNK